MDENDINCDPYVREQSRLRKLCEDLGSLDEEDPYADEDGEFGSHKNYEPSESLGFKS